MEEMKDKKPLDVRYREALALPRPNKVFVREVAEVAHVSKFTAYNWMIGRNMPPKPVRVLLSMHYGLADDELFSKGHFKDEEGEL